MKMDRKGDGQNLNREIYLRSLSKSEKMCLKLCGVGVNMKRKWIIKERAKIQTVKSIVAHSQNLKKYALNCVVWGLTYIKNGS